MKDIYILIVTCLLFSACAEKTKLLNTSKSSKQLISSIDSIVNKNIVTVDRSTIVTELSIDTSVTVIGRPITIELNTRATNDSNVISQHIENDDVDLKLFYNKQTGTASAMATPKPKKVQVKFTEKTTVRNNISKTGNSKSMVKGKLETNSDTLATHELDHKDPTIEVKSFKATVITFVIIVLIIVILFRLKKHFSIR